MFRLHNARTTVLDRYRNIAWSRDLFSMLLVSRAILVIPLAIISISFVLTAVSVFAGIRTGSLQDYDIMRVHTIICPCKTRVAFLADSGLDRWTRRS